MQRAALAKSLSNRRQAKRQPPNALPSQIEIALVNTGLNAGNPDSLTPPASYLPAWPDRGSHKSGIC